MRTLSTLLLLLSAACANAQVAFTPMITLSSYPQGVVDMNGDHLDDVVTPGTTSVQVWHQAVGGGLTLTTIPTPAANNTASWSFCAADVDENGYTDMLYGGSSGATFMFANSTGTGFTEFSPPNFIFCQRTNFVDINADGALDAFVCHDIDSNVFFLNNGMGGLTYNQSSFGTGESGGNYGSIWVDFDNDHDVDCFVAKCGGDPIDMFLRNDGGLNFTSIAAANGFVDSHQSWSSAWGDFDNDGDMDVLVGSSSSSYHKLMRNDMGSFTNVTAGSGFDTFGGQSIEWVTHDFDNDGYLDILGGYGFLRGNGNMTFTQQTITPINGPIGDLNDDGFLDIVSGNTVYANNGNSNHWITIATVGTVSNVDGIGARVVVESPSFTQIRDVRAGDGFADMSTLNTHVGLGADATIDQVTIYWPSGIVDVITNVAVDQTLVAVEGFSTALADEAAEEQLLLHPNPVDDVLYLKAPESMNGRIANIHDVTGKLVRSGRVTNDLVDVDGLPAGTYVLALADSRGIVRGTFVKR